MTTKRNTMGTVSFFIVVIAASTFIGKTVSRLPFGDYDCKCSYSCPSWGVQGGQCWDNDYMMWGFTTHTYCCVPSFLDYDHPMD
ncbi:hypothetical protein ACJMK2_008608 [Sinanodonta woodiana]|uniref:Uncharacterized protein n=1 Tax=Sinanodonta woodiana TaxID=1069815 RepID=A0ABD3VM40_SINWO